MAKSKCGTAGTTNNSFYIGDGKSSDKRILADIHNLNKPEIRYNNALGIWELSNDGISFSGIGAGSSSYFYLIFEAQGYYREAQNIDITEAMSNFTISEVKVLRQIAGTDGYTSFQLYNNGIGVFNTVPIIPYTTGDGYSSLLIPNNTTVSSGNKLYMNILVAEQGDPQDLKIIIKGI